MTVGILGLGLIGGSMAQDSYSHTSASRIFSIRLLRSSN